MIGRGSYVYVTNEEHPRCDDEGLVVGENEHTVVVLSYLMHDRFAVLRTDVATE